MSPNLAGLTIYLPLDLREERIHDKFKELVQMLRKTDYFNKLSEKIVKMEKK